MANQNLARIPEDFTGHWGGLGFYSNLFLDNNVVRTAGKPSIRIEPDKGDNAARECDCNWYACKVGDRIIATVWIKIENGRPYYAWSGARTGIDLYYSGPNGEWYNLGGEKVPLPVSQEDWYVHWGTQGWVLRTIDFIVPADYFTHDYLSGQTISPVQANMFCFWLQVWSSTLYSKESGNAWFADAELYINPTEEPPILPYPCQFCDLAFATEAEFIAHIIAVHPQPVYTCPQCSAEFATAEELAAHVASAHPTPPPSASVAARCPCFGNRALVQVYMRRLRDKVFSKRAHERLHPLV